MFNLYNTSITFISQPLFEICSNLAKLIFDLLNKTDVKQMPQKNILKTELIIRESSAKK